MSPEGFRPTYVLPSMTGFTVDNVSQGGRRAAQLWNQVMMGEGNYLYWQKENHRKFLALQPIKITREGDWSPTRYHTIIIMIGSNDHNRNLAPTDQLAHGQQIAKTYLFRIWQLMNTWRTKAGKVHVILPPPRRSAEYPHYHLYLQGMLQMLQTLLTGRGIVRVCEGLYGPNFMPKAGMMHDGAHLTLPGYRILRSYIMGLVTRQWSGRSRWVKWGPAKRERVRLARKNARRDPARQTGKISASI